MIENITAKSGPARCTYCSGNVTGEWSCSNCAATMHDDCYQEYGKCGSCNTVAETTSSRELPAGGWDRRALRGGQIPRPAEGWQPRRVNHPWYVKWWRALGEWWSNLWHTPRLSNSFHLNSHMSRFQREERRKKVSIVIAIIAIVCGVFGYVRAYQNSAEAITIIVAEKTTHSDDDGTSYHIYTHGGRSLTLSQSDYYRLRVDHRYEVVIAGVISKSHLVAINREIPLRSK